jgi:large subunit ribosomal protein L23
MQAHSVIIKPLVTEKSMHEVGSGKYAFVVSREANKDDIRKAVHQAFKVTVIGVSTSVMKGKTKRVGARRQEVPGAVWKKAIVTLKKGEKISLFETGADSK